MTVRQTPAQKARKRYLTAAGKSLTLIADEVAKHQAALAAGEIPGGTFEASARKYFESLAVITALDSLEAPATAGDDGTTEVRRHDLAEFTGLIKGLVPAVAAAPGDTPYSRLAAAAEEPPFDTTPQGAPPDGPGKE